MVERIRMGRKTFRVQSVAGRLQRCRSEEVWSSWLIVLMVSKSAPHSRCEGSINVHIVAATRLRNKPCVYVALLESAVDK